MWVCPQKLDERNKRAKTDGLDAKALCLRLDRFVQGNKDALAIVRVPTQEEQQKRALHRQREQLVKARMRLEAQGRSFDGQSRDRATKELVEAGQLQLARSACLDEGVARQQPAHFTCAAGKDQRAKRSTASGRPTKSTARSGSHDQCDHRSGDRQLEPVS